MRLLGDTALALLHGRRRVGVGKTNSGVGKGIGVVAVRGDKVDGERVRRREDEEDERDDHGQTGVELVGDDTSQRRHHGTTEHTTNDEARATLRVAAQTAHAEGDDGREADRLEEEHNVQHGNACVVTSGDGGDDEDNTSRQEGEEDEAGLDELHERDTEEATQSKTTLGTGEEARGSDVTDTRTHGVDVVDEEGGNGDLRAHVAELGKRGVEEAVLLAEGLVSGAGVSLSSLVGHVGVGDLGNVAQEEEGGEEQDKGGNGDVDPLDVGDSLGLVVEAEESNGACGRRRGVSNSVMIDFRSGRIEIFVGDNIPTRGATIVPMPLKAWDKLMRISE